MIPCCVPFNWKLSTILPTDREDDILDTSQPLVPRDKLLRSYIVWRRGALIFLFPLVAAETAISISSLIDELYVLESYIIELTFLGWTTRVSQMVLSPMSQVIGAFFAVKNWNNIKVSQWWFNSAIALTLVLYLWPAFVQIEDIYSYDLSNISLEKMQTILSTEFSFKYGFSIWLPYFLAIPSGSIRGAMNIMGLINDSVVPGCLILLLTPFGTLMHLAIFTSVIQYYGSWLLGIAFLFLILGKLKVYYYRSIYVEGDVQEMQKQMVGLKGLAFTLTGFACLLVWAFTTQYDDSQTVAEIYLNDKTWLDLVRLVHGWFTKVCQYSLIFTDAILHFVLVCEGDRQWSCRGMRNFFY